MSAPRRHPRTELASARLPLRCPTPAELDAAHRLFGDHPQPRRSRPEALRYSRNAGGRVRSGLQHRRHLRRGGDRRRCRCALRQRAAAASAGRRSDTPELETRAIKSSTAVRAIRAVREQPRSVGLAVIAGVHARQSALFARAAVLALGSQHGLAASLWREEVARRLREW